MTKPKPKDDLFGSSAPPLSEQPDPATVRRTAAKTKRASPPKKVQGGYTGVGATKPKPPTTGSGVVPARAKPKRKRKPPGTAVAVARPPAPVNLLSLIGQALVNPTIDTEKLRGIVDWYDKREADNAFARDYLAMAKKLPEITKDGTIDQGITRSGRQGVKAKFATYENIHEATSSILHAHGFTLSTYNSMRGEETVLVLRLEHYDPRFGASFRESIRPVVRDDGPGKTAVQALGSGEQYLKRRMVISILNLRSRAPEDRDHDGADPAKVEEAARTINGSQAKAAMKKVDDCGVPSDVLMNKFKALGITRINDMPLGEYEPFLKACDNYAAELKKRGAANG
jgi:hypothetical protein